MQEANETQMWRYILCFSSWAVIWKGTQYMLERYGIVVHLMTRRNYPQLEIYFHDT